MKIVQYDDFDAWKLGRKGKISGTRLKDIVSLTGITKPMIAEELTALDVVFKKSDKKEILEALLPQESLDKLKKALPKKKGFWEIIAERIAIAPDDEKPMERGVRLEPEAVERFIKETGKEVCTDLVIWLREDNDSIGISPDGYMLQENDKKITEAVEIKCLNSASHLEANYTDTIPDDYKFQVLQYFIVNDDLETLHFTFYDPRVPSCEFFIIEVKREDMQKEIEEYLAHEKFELIHIYPRHRVRHK